MRGLVGGMAVGGLTGIGTARMLNDGGCEWDCCGAVSTTNGRDDDELRV